MDERKWQLMRGYSKEIIDDGLVQFNITHPEFRFGTPTNSEITEYTHRIYEFMRVDRVTREQRGESVPIEHKLLASTSIQWVNTLLGSILWYGINTPLVTNWLISEFQQHYRQLLVRENHSYASLTPSEFASKMLMWLRDYRLGIR